MVWERGILNMGKALEVCGEVVYQEGWEKNIIENLMYRKVENWNIEEYYR